MSMSDNTMTAPTLDAGEKRALAQEERAIAQKYIGLFPAFMVFWWFTNLCTWFAIWPLYFTGILPLWAAGLLSFLCITLSYLPSHEAQHGNIGQRGSMWRWLNELIGHTSTIPLVLPYLTARLTHMQHHAHANDPELDPDISTKARNSFDFLVQYVKFLQPGAPNHYGACLERHPDRAEAKAAILETLALRGLFLGVMVGLAWSGYAIEAACIWWLPKFAAGAYIRYFLSWAPHHPAEEKGRYRDTRAWRFLMGGQIGNILALGMEYHVVHHLHPNIPLNYTPRAYWEMKSILEKRGCRIDGL